jgi:hypothetical protein
VSPLVGTTIGLASPIPDLQVEYNPRWRLICPAPIEANMRKMPTTQRLLGLCPGMMKGSKSAHPMPALFWRTTSGSARCVREMRKLMAEAGGSNRCSRLTHRNRSRSARVRDFPYFLLGAGKEGLSTRGNAQNMRTYMSPGLCDVIASLSTTKLTLNRLFGMLHDFR